MSHPVTMLVSYYPKEGQEQAFFEIMQRHWPTLDELGLVTSDKPRIFRATDKDSGRQYFIEIFSWKDEGASDLAHQSPEVMAVWEPMGPLLERMQLSRVEEIAEV
ncbi:MAG: hypothetical protein KC503_19565 [Myxococcales bacterium]|nr:hypothetical protein [Myxococcales bacterium]